MIKKIASIVLSGIIFVLLSSLWMERAKVVPMDNDEFYSQVASVEGGSWGKIWSGHIEEGNNSPLFYSLQKLYQQCIGYHTPEFWMKGQWGYQHPTSLAILRLLPVLFMSAGITVLYFYTTMRFGFIMGFYGLAIALSTYMVWAYAVVARPYALWFFLTALQIALALFWLESKPKTKQKLVVGLMATHLLLSLTMVLSVLSNFAVCVLLWGKGLRKAKDHVILLVVPTLVSLFYYMHAPKYPFFLKNGMMKLLGASLPLDRLVIIFTAVLLLSLSGIKQLKKWFNPLDKALGLVLAGVLGFGAMVLAGCVAVLIKFKMGASLSNEGFEVSNRYFMVLAPVAILMTVASSYILFKLPKAWPIKQGVLIFLGALLLFRFYKLWVLLPH